MTSPDHRTALLERARASDDLLAQLLGLLIEVVGEAATVRQDRAPAGGAASGGGGGPSPSGGKASASRGVVKFGRDSGKAFADVEDLGWYRAAILRSVDDPAKAQYRQWNLDDLAAIDAVIAGRNGGGQASPPAEDWGGMPDGPPPPDEDIPF